MIAHEIGKECYKCLCRVCGEVGCPHRNYKYKRCFLCWRDHEYRPILDCYNFYFKRCFHRYKIRRIFKQPEIRYVDKINADDIRVMLGEILDILKSNGGAVRDDINCIKNECICITCIYRTKCNIRCDNCKNYAGESPVRMCGRKSLQDRGYW